MHRQVTVNSSTLLSIAYLPTCIMLIESRSFVVDSIVGSWNESIKENNQDNSDILLMLLIFFTLCHYSSFLWNFFVHLYLKNMYHIKNTRGFFSPYLQLTSWRSFIEFLSSQPVC